MPNAQWRPFTAEQVISVHRPGFAWLARMQAIPLLSAHILDCYVDGEGFLEARLCGSLPLARGAGQEVSKGELMRYLAELIWAPHAMQRNPQLSWRGIDASTAEVSAASAGGPARVWLIFEDGDIARIEADDRPRRGRTSYCADAVGRILRRLPRDGRLPRTNPGGGELVVGRRPFRILARQSNRVWREVTVETV